MIKRDPANISGNMWYGTKPLKMNYDDYPC